MEGDFIKINHWLTPLSWLYGLGVGIRNFLFDIGVLESRAFSVPIISVGNITVGGAGKTPHVEYLIRLLKERFNVAVLSRGYKRKSRGFVLADESSTMSDIGDEPLQMHRKFPDIAVAVDRKRCHGIDQLMELPETCNTDVVLLDDAYQHRYVKPGINILLVDYHRLIIYDKLLPAGRLREPMSGKTRADIVIVTKCPKDLKPMSFRVLSRAMSLFPYQQLYFTYLEYGNPKGIFSQKECSLKELSNLDQVLLITGIASPEQMIKDLSPRCKKLEHLRFKDHHNFTQKDVDEINSRYAQLAGSKIIITTEKDATRLLDVDGLSDEVKANIYALPIEIKVMLDKQERFDQSIIDYVTANSRNSVLVKDAETRNSARKKKVVQNSDTKPTKIRF